MRVEWRTVGLIGFTYGGWVLAGWLLWPVLPGPALVVMTVLAALHSSLVHECIHGHPTRKRWLNELLVAANLSLVWPYRRFRTLHLRHHHDAHLTDPFEDPESYYRAHWQFRAMPGWARAMLRFNNTMVGRIILGPILGTFALAIGDARQIWKGDRTILADWLRHLMGLLPVLLLVIWLFQIPLWLYLVTVCWGAMGLISIRTFAEHRWADNVEGRTIIVEKTPLGWLFLNNNLHVVHHVHPSAAWYELPELFAQDRAFWVSYNQGYVFRNYWELFQKWGFHQKEWVDHPSLHVEPDVSLAVSHVGAENSRQR